MTQILTCLTASHVVLAADRRLTKVHPGGRVEVVDHDACKVVLLASAAVVAYTGLANLPRPPQGDTDLWLVDALSPLAGIPATLERLETSATEVFRRLSHIDAKARRHAFVVAGWSDGGGRPFYATVSNALGRSGGWLDAAGPEFEGRTEWLPRKSPFRLEAAGQPLSRSVRERLLSDLGDPANREPHRVAALLSNAIRETAAKIPTVGESLLVSVLPRETASETGRGVTMGSGVEVDASGQVRFPPQQGQVSFYLPAGGQTGVTYGPHCVDAGATIADVRVFDRALSPEEMRQLFEAGKKRLGRMR